MNELIDLRRQLLSGHLTQDQVREVKRHITVRLDWGNEWVTVFYLPENGPYKVKLKTCLNRTEEPASCLKGDVSNVSHYAKYHHMINILHKPAKIP